MFLDWDRYAITGSPGHFLTERKTARVAIKKTMHPPPCFVYPIYLVQSKKHFCKLHIAPHTCPNLQSIFQFSLFLPSFLMETLLWWLRNHLYSWGNYPFNCLIKVFTRHICSIKARILTVQQVLLIKKKRHDSTISREKCIFVQFFRHLSTFRPFLKGTTGSISKIKKPSNSYINWLLFMLFEQTFMPTTTSSRAAFLEAVKLSQSKMRYPNLRGLPV